MAALIGMSLFALAPQRASAEDWKCYHSISAATVPTYVALVRIAEDLEKITKGRVKVKCNVGGSLPIDANSISPAVADGILDLVGTEYISGYVPVAGITVMPGLYADQKEYDKAYKVLEPIVKREFEKRGIVTLGKYYYPDQTIWGTIVITKLSDIKGKVMRVANDEQSEFAKAVGAVPVVLPTADVAPALQRGAVQLALTAAAGAGRIWHDHFHSVMLNAANLSIGWIQISKKRWDRLSPEEQKALQASADKHTAWATQELNDDTEKLLKEWKEKENLVITPKDPAAQAEIAKALEPYWKKWAEERGPEAIKALAAIRAAIGK
jgi:TRAP-type C4-dicarboxylate transport system substrate-binding protein